MRAYKWSSKQSVPATMSVNLHFSGNLFFIVGFCERKFRTVISGFLFFFFQVMLSRDPGWERREINPDRSRKKKNKLSDNLSLRNANKICRSRTVASGAPRHRNGTKIYLAICHFKVFCSRRDRRKWGWETRFFLPTQI